MRLSLFVCLSAYAPLSVYSSLHWQVGYTLTLSLSLYVCVCVVFAPLDNGRLNLLKYKVIYVSVQMISVGMALTKINYMGVLPTSLQDFFPHASVLPPRNYSPPVK